MSKTIGERIVEEIDSNVLTEQGGTDGCSWIDADSCGYVGPLPADILTKFIQGDPKQKCFEVGHDKLRYDKKIVGLREKGEIPDIIYIKSVKCLRCGEEF